MERMLASLSQAVARSLQLPREEEEVLHYGMVLAALTFLNVAAVALTGFFLHALGPTLLAAAVAASLKKYAGGAHAATPFNCLLLGALVFGGAGWLAANAQRLLPPESIPGVFVFSLLTAALAIARYAPSDTPAKPVQGAERRAALRRQALARLAGWGVALAALGAWAAATGAAWAGQYLLAGTLGLIWQSLTLPPVGHRLVAAWDGTITCFTGRRCAA